MVDTDIRDGAGCVGSFTVEMHDVADIRAVDPFFGERADTSKLRILDTVDPVQRSTQENVTCVGLHELIPAALHAGSPAPSPVTELALGRSDAGTDSGDTSLTDPVGRVGVTAFSHEGNQLHITVFVGEGEANVDTDAGETLSEAGFYAGDVLLNHSLFDTEYEKDDTKTLTAEGTLSFTNL